MYVCNVQLQKNIIISKLDRECMFKIVGGGVESRQFGFALSKDSDQPGHMPSLIRVSTKHLLHS